MFNCVFIEGKKLFSFVFHQLNVMFTIVPISITSTAGMKRSRKTKLLGTKVIENRVES